MEKKTFSKIEIAVIKRTAQNVSQFTSKKAKLNAQIAELQAEIAALQPIIDSFQGPIKSMTGGYTTEDLVTKETVHTGKMDPKTGKEVIQTRFVLKYPDTVVPNVPATKGLPGSDYDIDANAPRAAEEMPEELMAEQAAAETEAQNADPFAENSWN